MWFIDMNTDDLSNDQLNDARKLLGQLKKKQKCKPNMKRV